MTLIPVSADQSISRDTLTRLTISPRQQMLAGIRSDIAKQAPSIVKLTLTGTTLFSPEQQDVISAPVSGWIEKMYVRNPGEKISLGGKLYDLYSPELLSAEKDYLLTLQQQDFFKGASADSSDDQTDLMATIRSMKQKLLRWGLSEEQIHDLGRQKLSGKVTFFSKWSGYLIQKMAEEGSFVKEGGPVLNLANDHTMWVQAQIYDQELPLLSGDIKIEVEVPALRKKLSGKIAYDNPVNEQNSRVHLVNIIVSNSGRQIQPGMLAYVYLETENDRSGLFVPRTAIIYGEKYNYAWVALGSNVFERRKVQVGEDQQTMVQVLQGIKPGDDVVSSGAFLLNSEYILKHGSGVNLSGMQMSDMQMKGRSN